MNSCGVATALRIPADHAAVPFVRFTIVALLMREGWRGEPTSRVLLAASEAISNAIDHGSPPGGVVSVRLQADPARAELIVRDQGRDDAWRPAFLPVRRPPATSPHGRGLVIMHRLAEHLELRPAGAGTEVVAAFRAAVSAARCAA
ncbi:MAG: ATP-binding protein [Thermoleophilia bacterium]|jgi:anti-sigma regulatory factor (Ser/Thr protein kinase)